MKAKMDWRDVFDAMNVLANSLAGLIGAIGALFVGIAALGKAGAVRVSSSSRKNRSRIPFALVGILLVGLSASVLGARLLTGDTHSLNVELTNAAWEALNHEEYKVAVTKAEGCIKTFEKQARREQQAFTSSDQPTPPVGEVPLAIKSEILNRGVLNDVATCYFIKGQAYEGMNAFSDAKDAYTRVLEFPDGRAWDPKGWFWSPAQAAADRLSVLP